MGKYFKRIYYYLKEKNVYNREVKHLGLTFSEFSSYANNIKQQGFICEDTLLLGKKIKKIANYQYVECIMEIFVSEVYKFKTDKEDPLILDCGANIGLSTIYFKQLYPKAKIIAFEADPNMMKLCSSNINSFGLTGINLVQAAVWNTDGHMTFLPNDTLGGKLNEDIKSSEAIEVKTVRLKSYLKEYVDFLKMDIEGAEVDVLLDVKDDLKNVGALFVEYHSQRDREDRFDILLNALKGAGFRFYIKEAAPLMNKPFMDYKNKKFEYTPFDMQLNIFAYRL